MLALTGTTGKIGGATLKAILDGSLASLNTLVICTSSEPGDARWDHLKKDRVKVRKSNYDDPISMIKAFSGCSKLLLVSTPRIEMDFNNPPDGEGRENHHYAAIRAAQTAGIAHIYYTSLAFGSDSEAAVMKAHLRTEAFLHSLKVMKITIIREGLYNESWPLYFGYYDVKKDKRMGVIVAGDGLISWTAITDLGLGTALLVTDPSMKYAGTLYLSASKAATPKDISRIVSEAKGQEVNLRVVTREGLC